MLYWLFIFIGFLILFVVSQWLLHWLEIRQIKINRWIWGWASFLVVLLPYFIWPKMNHTVLLILFIFCGVFAINFMTEQHKWIQKNSHI